MHEFSLAKTLLAQVDRLRREHEAAQVLTVCVEVGELSGVEPELLEMAFDRLTACGPLHGARLDIQRVPLSARCASCGNEFDVRNFTFRCGNCNSTQVSVLRGENLVLREVTMEGMDPHHE